MKNNKSPGYDNLSAKLLKNSPPVIHEYIAEIYNEMAETGKYPCEIKDGLLIPLQKPGKEKGKIENLRPVILLNVVRKILAIIMLERLFERFDKEISISQSAYRPGRSTTENVFALKLCEKAIISQHYEANILLLDMSKAFDNVNRGALFRDLIKIVGSDEIHILKILIEDVVIKVKNGKTTGKDFVTNIGVPQDDCLSPILFTLYLSKTMESMEGMEENNQVLEHDYAKEKHRFREASTRSSERS